MSIKNKLRIFLFNLFGSKNIDFLRYLKFSYKFGKFSNIADRGVFVDRFSNFYEKEMAVIPRLIKNPKVIVDIGSNYGTYSFFFSKLYPESKILAFEPSERTYNIFRRIIKRFNLKNVFPIKKGLGIKEEEKEIVMPMQYTILAYISEGNAKRNKEDRVEKIEITTMDKFVKRNKIKKIDFIKCDIEGFELSAFKGARKTLKKFKPTILTEIEERHTKKYGINPQDVLKFLKKLGYKPYSMRGNLIEKADKIVPEIPLYIFSRNNLI